MTALNDHRDKYLQLILFRQIKTILLQAATHLVPHCQGLLEHNADRGVKVIIRPKNPVLVRPSRGSTNDLVLFTVPLSQVDIGADLEGPDMKNF